MLLPVPCKNCSAQIFVALQVLKEVFEKYLTSFIPWGLDLRCYRCGMTAWYPLQELAVFAAKPIVWGMAEFFERWMKKPKDLKRAKEEYDRLCGEVELKRRENDELSAEKEGLKNEIEGKRKVLKEIEGKMRAGTEELWRLERKIEAGLKKLAAVDQEIEKKTEMLRKIDGEIGKRKGELTSLIEGVEKQKRKLMSLMLDYANIEAMRDALLEADHGRKKEVPAVPV